MLRKLIIITSLTLAAAIPAFGRGVITSIEAPLADVSMIADGWYLITVTDSCGNIETFKRIAGTDFFD